MEISVQMLVRVVSVACAVVLIVSALSLAAGFWMGRKTMLPMVPQVEGPREFDPGTAAPEPDEWDQAMAPEDSRPKSFGSL
jgi:hypothetical protein